MDTQGLPLALLVQAASVQDPAGAAPVLAEAKANAPQWQLLWADARYQGPLVATAAAALGLRGRQGIRAPQAAGRSPRANRNPAQPVAGRPAHLPRRPGRAARAAAAPGAGAQVYCLIAPVAGTVTQLAGSYVQAGELLGTLSPDGDLLAECYVSPKDIGFVRAGMPVRLQVDAFDYNQWGMLDGHVTEVARDYVLLSEKQPVFKVRCQLSRSYLQLKNGYRGNLRKSMTVRARFLLAERSLWQLLFDKADDWLNPAQNGAG